MLGLRIKTIRSGNNGKASLNRLKKKKKEREWGIQPSGCSTDFTGMGEIETFSINESLGTVLSAGLHEEKC